MLLTIFKGGHLSLTLSYMGHLPQVKAVVSLYAPTELRNKEIMEKAYSLSFYDVVHSLFYIRGIQDLCLNTKNMSDCFRLLSPTALADRSDLPKTLIVHGASDSIVPVFHGKYIGICVQLMTRIIAHLLVEKLKSVGAKHGYLEVPCETHSCEERCSAPCMYLTSTEEFEYQTGSQAIMFALDRFISTHT